MKQIDIKLITNMSAIAALYVVLTLLFHPISYGDIQFRISEILVLLVFYRREYSIPLVIGCLIANLFSSAGIHDVIFGTLATLIVVIIMPFIKNKYLSASIPVIVNALIIGAMLSKLYEIPFFLVAAQVGFGQFVVIYLIGLPVFRSLEKNELFKDILDIEEVENTRNETGFLSSHTLYVFALCIVLTVLFFKLPLDSFKPTNEDTIYYSFYYYTMNRDMLWGLVLLFLPFLNIITISVLNKKANFILSVLLVAGSITIITIMYTFADAPNILFISIYYVTLICLLGLNILKLKEKQV